MNKEIYEKYEIIDSHAHIFPDKIARNATVNIGKFYGIPMDGYGTSEKLIESGSKIGVSKYLVCSVATVPHQIRAINSFIRDECELHPEFFGFGSTHTKSEDIEGDINAIIRHGLHGVKLHPDFQEFDADSPEAYKIYELIEDRLPLLIHCGDAKLNYSAPIRIAHIHRDFPKLKIIAAHLGGYQRWDEAEKCLVGLENVKVDISSSISFMSSERAIELIKKYGVENCFFGVDFPMWRHEDELERFLSFGFSEKENQMILADNFKDFFGIKD